MKIGGVQRKTINVSLMYLKGQSSNFQVSTFKARCSILARTFFEGPRSPRHIRPYDEQNIHNI